MRALMKSAAQYLIAIGLPIVIAELAPAQPAVSPFFLWVALVARFVGFGPALAAMCSSAAILWLRVLPEETHPVSVQLLRLLLFVTAAVVVASVSRQRSKDVREAEERYRMLVESSPDGIAVIDERGKLLFANRALARILGAADVIQLVGRETLDFISSEYHERARSREAQLLAGRSLPPFEESWLRLDGTTVDVEVAAVPIRKEGRVAGHLFVRDISDRRAAERSVQQLSGRLLHLQDEERRQIARELHDTTAQSLIAVRLNLAIINEAGAASEPAVKAAMIESVALTDQSIAEIRTLSYLLHPPIIDEAGLVPSLEWYTRGFNERSRITTTLDAPDEIGRLPRDVETAVFRVVQEALTNIQRHSGSAVARIRLRREPAHLQLEIADEGKGFPRHLRDRPDAVLASGLGIAGIHQRVKELAGQLTIQSEDSGTRLLITLPIAEK